MTAQRIVSLVPSLTEAIWELGAAERLVGRTRFCIEPAGAIESVADVGGTKNPDIEAIVSLAPDLVVVNAEENRREDYDALVAAGLSVHVTHPKTVLEAASMIDEIGPLIGEQERASTLAADIRSASASLHTGGNGRRVFCPIWRNPWMTFHDETYVGDVLRTLGLENVFGDPGAAEGAAESDFFTVEMEAVIAAAPEIVILPDEPYVFGPDHEAELRAAGVRAGYLLIDGKELSWYGTRLPGALERLSAALRNID